MSVRRLAEENVQPSGFAFNESNAVWAQATIKKYPEGRQQSAVIPLLMRAQEQDGWVTKAAIESVADMLDMAYIRVLEVATFYTQFQLKPIGTRAHIQVCGTTPCMLRGSEDLIKLCKKRIHAEPLHQNEAGTLSWEEVECQGACVNAPMVMIFKDSYEDLTVEKLEHIIDAFEAGNGAEVTPGTQIDRIYSAPEGGLTTLTEPYVKGRNQVTEAPAPAGDAGPQEPDNAARAKDEVAEADKSVKTPLTAKTESAANDKLRGEQKETGVVEKAPDGGGSTAAGGKPSLDHPDRPAGIERPATSDDLKMISGVGPKIEGTLHELGIFTFKQIAGWTAEQRAWVDSYLNFRGRIDRDNWVKQAEVLATGGEAEYIKVFGKKPR